MASPPQSPVPRYIARIRVEGLFGQFDHDLVFRDGVPANPNLLILYGENGTGKTTLLWMLYHLLNRHPAEGHRSYLARQRFKRFFVRFTDGLQISAEREAARPGDFGMTLSQGQEQIAAYEYKADENGRVPPATRKDPEHSRFVEALPYFNFGFLPHDRLTVSHEDGPQRRPPTLAPATPSEESSPISSSIARAIGTARQRAIGASNQGQLTTNAIYTDLVQQIVHVDLTLPANGVEEKRLSLVQRLTHQARLAREYSRFGLSSELQIEGLVGTLQTMLPERLNIAAQVLEPFLLGNEARFAVLEPLHIALTTMVGTVNSMYLNKRISLHLEKGLQISTFLTDEKLLPEQLSSGEQELLILFCEVISALSPSTVLFIDEPELSLNVSWQKNLLEALLKCGSGSSVQFVIATHSIELLTRYRSNVTRLSKTVVGPLEVNPEGGKAEA